MRLNGSNFRIEAILEAPLWTLALIAVLVTLLVGAQSVIDFVFLK